MLKKIVVLSFKESGGVRTETIQVGGTQFEITEHRIGMDFDAGRELVQQYDGHVDGIALGGVQRRLSAGSFYFSHPGYLNLIRSATQTPLYIADDLRDFFANWTLQRLLRDEPQFFAHRRVLFHCASVGPLLNKIQGAGARIRAADPLVLTGIPKSLGSARQLEAYLRLMEPLVKAPAIAKLRPKVHVQKQRVQSKLAQWIRESEIFVTFGNLLDQFESLECLQGKVLIVDYLSTRSEERLAQVNVGQVIELIPNSLRSGPLKDRPLSVLTAVLDQQRKAERSLLSPEEYLLNWVQRQKISPNRYRATKKPPRRCGFIIHPLAQSYLWKVPALQPVKRAPKQVRDTLEAVAARLPVIHYGTLSGAVSDHNGQEVICDLYGMLATPKQLLSMNEEMVYKRLVQAAEMAHQRGSLLFGLGAYTKVVGDGGVTVTRSSPIPVTTGNSYSASTTLWAARIMVERMGLISPIRVGNRFRAKAMIIGATGSIGRVSSLLSSLVFDELVLVATQPDKLLELRQEILEVSPGIDVKVTTDANPELHDTDLVVTATSNQTGQSVLDIERLKPGAVVCDCSRPLDVGPEEAAKRPDVMVIESGEVLLPGAPKLDCDIGLPKPSVYACLAETVLLTMEGRYENFSYSKQLSMNKVKEIYRLGLKHGATLSEIRGPSGVITDEQVMRCRELALERLKTWPSPKRERLTLHEASSVVPGLRLVVESPQETSQQEIEEAVPGT